PCPAVFPRCRPVGLHERLKQLRLGVAADANARVADFDAQSWSIGAATGRFDVSDDLSAFRELHGVAEKVQNDLTKAAGIAAKGRRYVRLDEEREFEPLGAGLFGEQVERALHRLAKVEVHAVELELAGFNLREIENVIDDCEQRICAAFD